MKTRKGFRRIVVDGTEYLYAVSLRVGKLMVYQGACRFEWSLSSDVAGHSWRGKAGDGVYGKREVAEIIRRNVVT